LENLFRRASWYRKSAGVRPSVKAAAIYFYCRYVTEIKTREFRERFRPTKLRMHPGLAEMSRTGVTEMRKLTITIVAMTALFVAANAPSALAAKAHGGGSGVSWFYLTEIVTTTGNQLTTSSLFSTQAACTTASQAGGVILVQGCVADCDPANSKSEYFLEQSVNGKFHGFGPYGFESDCEAGSLAGAAAVSANTSVSISATCTSVTARKAAC
jgi:hypothetical protein